MIKYSERLLIQLTLVRDFNAELLHILSLSYLTECTIPSLLVSFSLTNHKEQILHIYTPANTHKHTFFSSLSSSGKWTHLSTSSCVTDWSASGGEQRSDAGVIGEDSVFLSVCVKDTERDGGGWWQITSISNFCDTCSLPKVVFFKRYESRCHKTNLSVFDH